jgi:hypothetical protein
VFPLVGSLLRLINYGGQTSRRKILNRPKEMIGVTTKVLLLIFPAGNFFRLEEKIAAVLLY